MLGFFGDLFTVFFGGFSHWSPPPAAVLTALLLATISSFLLTRFTAGRRTFTMPVCFILLFFAGLFCNYLGRGVQLSGTTEMQTTVLLTMVGQVVASFLLLLLLKTDHAKPGRS